MLAPGSGVAEEKALLGAMKEIRDGRVEQAVEALTAAKDQAPAEARVAIDERIAMLYLAAYRWDEAIRHAEAHLFGAAPPVTDGAESSATSLREALGVAPPVWVELIGAYGRTGDLDRAGRMLIRLEEVCAHREDAALWIHRARLMFLALAGRPDSVQTLLASRNGKHMSPAARTYWIAVAHDHRGDRAAAATAYEKARGRSRGRPRELIEQALAKLSAAARGEDRRAVVLSPTTQATVERIEAAPPPATVKVARPRGPWATVALTASVIAVAAVIALALGPSSDPGVLVRAGAMVRGRIEAGEWWRVISCVFVHVGMLHLIVNGVGLYILGRVAEELYEGTHVVTIFGCAGVAGGLASYLASPVGVSAGASGAIFGLLGALFVELTVHRDRYRAAWKRGLWGGLVVVTVGQAAVGFLYPVIDQWAHGAGLAGGALAGALLSPHARWARAGRYLGHAIALAFAGLAIAAAVLVVRTSVADSYLRDEEVKVHTIGAVAITAPARWVADTELHDPDKLIIFTIESHGLEKWPGNPEQTDLAAFATRRAKDRGFERFAPAPAPIADVPAPWVVQELEASILDQMDYRQRYTLIIAARRFGDTTISVLVYVPASIGREIAPLLSRVIGSAGPT
ncbi:MAG: rhomboid family intramembrane serine protease [Deltaproteobacteria bacterium]|nr:rhomboid family intramembrane serine protease [Deltaproteobacteria bacterium]